MNTSNQLKYNKTWKQKNKDKVIVQNRTWKQRHPEMVKQQRIRYLDKKIHKEIDENPEYLDKLKGKLLYEFDRLTRLMFKSVLPDFCENCGATEDLHIHHKQYVYPIVKEDLIRLCRRCHIEEHQKV